jgi:hypothetical protein
MLEMMSSTTGSRARSPSESRRSKYFASVCTGVQMELDKDFSEFVELCIAHDVRFLIVGGYALAAHGLPRATGDLDAWVLSSHENANRIVVVLEEFGFGGVGVDVTDFEKADSIVQLGYPPFRIDILTSIDGVDFESAWLRRVLVQMGDVEVPFIGREDLIANKKAAGRPQDLVDVDRLTRSKD